MAYNKGVAGGISKVSPGVYAVDSWTQDGKTYLVNLSPEACTCPARGECKHLVAARAARFQQISEKARTLPTERLEELKDTYFGKDKAIWLAIDGELFDRYEAEMREGLRQDRQAARDQELRAIFA